MFFFVCITHTHAHTYTHTHSPWLENKVTIKTLSIILLILGSYRSPLKVELQDHRMCSDQIAQDLFQFTIQL